MELFDRYLAVFVFWKLVSVSQSSDSKQIDTASVKGGKIDWKFWFNAS